MNWYSKTKTAGVEDFIAGSAMEEIRKFPFEDQLDDRQKKIIRELSYTQIYILDKVYLFKHYPHTCYFDLFDFKKFYSLYDNLNEEVLNFWNLFLNFAIEDKDKWSFIPSDLPYEIYEDMLKNEFLLNPKEKIACSIFEDPKGYPNFFIDYFKSLFPKIYEAYENPSSEKALDASRNFFECPSKENFTILASLMNAESNMARMAKRQNLPISNRFCLTLKKYLLDIDKYKKWVMSINTGTDYRNILYQDGKSFIDEYNQLMNKYVHKGVSKDKVDNDGEILYFIEKSESLSKIEYFQYKSIRFNKESYEKLISMIINYGETNYYEVFFFSSLNMEKEKDNSLIIDGNPNSIGILLKIEESSEIKYVAPSGFLGSTFDNYGLTRDVYDCVSNISGYSGLRESSDFFYNWYLENKEKNKNNLDYFYIDLLNNFTFISFIEKADRALSGHVLNSHEFLSSDYKDGDNLNYFEESPFELEILNKIFNDIPINLRNSGIQLPYWFVIFSGLFPCGVVKERFEKNCCSDSNKYIHGIKCIGNTNLLKNNLYELVENKKSTVLKETRTKIPEFFDSNAVIKKKIEDFKEVFIYARSIICKNMYDYSKRDISNDRIKFALESLSNIEVYIVDREKIKNNFTDEQLNFSGLNPDKLRGKFFSYSNIITDSSCIVVFSGEDDFSKYGIDNILISVLGIDRDPNNVFKKMDEEGTFWHEVVHGSLYAMGISLSENPDNIMEWLKDPEELIAISHGNLQFIKNKLKKFFTDKLPSSGELNQGLLSHIKSDIVNTFSWEFQGITKDQAYKLIDESIPDFAQDVLSISENMTKNEKVELLTNMFTNFFMRRMLRGKIEGELDRRIKEMKESPSDKKIEHKEEVKPKEEVEQYDRYSPIAKDSFILELEKRSDYIDFFKKVQEFINKLYLRIGNIPQHYYKYVHKNDKKIVMKPYEFKDLLKFIFKNPYNSESVLKQELNTDFQDIIPASLLRDVLDIFSKENKRKETLYKEKETKNITPDEAEDLGGFLSDQDEAYGLGWEWIAKNNSWYKKAKDDLI